MNTIITWIFSTCVFRESILLYLLQLEHKNKNVGAQKNLLHVWKKQQSARGKYEQRKEKTRKTHIEKRRN